MKNWLTRLWDEQGGTAFGEGVPEAPARREPVCPVPPPPAPKAASPTLSAIRKGRRGVALVMVLAMVVFLSAFVVEFAYKSRVDYLQAAHYRDQVQAHYLAKSGVRIYTLFMAFAQTMGSNPIAQQYLAPMGIDLGDKLWQQLPFFDTAFLRFGLAGGIGDNEDFDMASVKQGRMEFEPDEKMERRIESAIERDHTALTRSFLDFEGDFRADINDEDGKINITALGDSNKADIRTEPIAMLLYSLMQHERYDEMFERRNDFDRWELLANIKDFQDADNQQSTLIGGYEDSLYDGSQIYGRGYKPKNLKFDSLDEVLIVAGMTDEIYQTFGPQWTIYGNNKVNITTCSDGILFALVRAFADYTVSDEQIRLVLGEIQVMRFMGMLDTKSFVSTLKTRGITLTDESGLSNLLKTNSRTFTIVSTGFVGDVESTIEVVMNFNGGRYKTLSWQER